jgi:hypothetical protein
MAPRQGPEWPRSRLCTLIRNRAGRDCGMNASQDRRLTRLERERRTAARVMYVWRNSQTETTKAAIARRFPDGFPRDARLVICSWQVAG